MHTVNARVRICNVNLAQYSSSRNREDKNSVGDKDTKQAVRSMCEWHFFYMQKKWQGSFSCVHRGNPLLRPSINCVPLLKRYRRTEYIVREGREGGGREVKINSVKWSERRKTNSNKYQRIPKRWALNIVQINICNDGFSSSVQNVNQFVFIFDQFSHTNFEQFHKHLNVDVPAA